MRFFTGATERMRIDSAGNLLVGKTTAAFGTAGVELKPSGETYVTRASATPLYVRRNTDDGDIVQFWKDGTPVGSIASRAGVVTSLILNPSVSAGAGITEANTGGGPSVSPTNGSGATADASIDLGTSSIRWQDLYLSGGVLASASSGNSAHTFTATANNTRATLTTSAKTSGGVAVEGQFGSFGDASKVDIGTLSNHATAFITNNTERMRIDSSGNLLVGTTSAGGSNGITFHSSGYIQPRTNTGIPAIYADREGSDGSIVELRKDGTSVGSIGTVAGDIVIGTGACGIRFHDGTPALQPRNTDGSANNDAIDIGLTGNRFKDLFLSGAAASGTSSNYLRFLHDGGNGIIDNTAGSLVFRRSGSFTESMRLDTSGNLLVGKTSTAAGDGTVIGSNGVSNCTASGTATLILNRQSSNGDCLEFRRQNVKVGSVSVSGTNATFNISSDQRLKQNIADADDAGSKIDAIQVRKFDWITDGSHQDYGMVAQELQGVAPEAVSIPDDPEEMMGVDYSKLVPMLVKEIQSLRARVAQLETEEAA
jgi:hypothetical protein